MEQQSDMPQRQRIFERAFSFKGRIKRAEFAMSYVITWIVGGIISMSVDEPEYVTMQDVIIVWLLLILVYWFYFAQRVKRCHDLGYSGWWQLIPFSFLILLFKKSDGDNRYGVAINRIKERS